MDISCSKLKPSFLSKVEFWYGCAGSDIDLKIFCATYLNFRADEVKCRCIPAQFLRVLKTHYCMYWACCTTALCRWKDQTKGHLNVNRYTQKVSSQKDTINSRPGVAIPGTQRLLHLSCEIRLHSGPLLHPPAPKGLQQCIGQSYSPWKWNPAASHRFIKSSFDR